MHISHRNQALAIGLSVLLLWLTLTAQAESPHQSSGKPPVVPTLHYNRDIRPLLAENCLPCHGPDRNKRAANLRLDQREEAMARGVLSPGQPQQSRLVARIFAADEAQRMPPPAAHRQLTPEQKTLLRTWIAQGAVYEPHWAFAPLPKRIEVPRVYQTGWPRNPIDHFVLSKLEVNHLAPSPPASRADWLRRVTLDLTGLPPTQAETDAYLTDQNPRAAEKVVDRLLASPRYGERMALPWLDVARYADSYGYQSDQLCPTWPYRDWVVRAFNDNMPYDRFLTAQIAGDLLPNATQDDRLATAFNRLHRMTNEGGSVPEEWRMEGVADRVRTFGTAFLGLTLECARCHDHKFDPITQKDYYAFSAFFNSIDEYGMYDRADIVPSPTLLLPTPEQAKQLAQAHENAATQEKNLAQVRSEGEIAFRRWLSQLALPKELTPGASLFPQGADKGVFRHPPVKAPLLPDQTGQFDFENFEGTALPNRVLDAVRKGERSDEVPLVEGHTGKAALFDGENNIHFPELGRFSRSTPFTIALWIRDARQTEGAAVVCQACDGTDAGPHGYDLLIEEGHLTARMFRHWPGNAIAVRTLRSIPKDAWAHVAVTYDGSSHAAGLKIYLDGKLTPCEIVRDHMVKGTGEHTLVLGQRFRDRGFKGGRIDDLAIFTRDITPLEVAQLYDGYSLTNALKYPQGKEEALRAYYLSAIDPMARKAAETLVKARSAVVQAEDAQYEIAVMEEMPQPRPAYILARGRYDAPKTDENKVGRTLPASLPAFPAASPRDRLGLAQWLTRPSHPLTARVEVNRIWALFFGRGLVETQEDFGIQGRLPTHPSLLDWMARDFVQSGWDVKALIKQIVLSSTYRQASALTPTLRDRDPQNVLLARGPSQRLGAETVRDLALFTAGLLDERRGGPPVSPYQPGDLWRESNTMSPAYHQSVGGDLYRRSLYTVWKRTAPMPNMTVFDAGSREVCIARRQTTNTPLQALVLLNDIQFVEAARKMGERALKEAPGSDAERVRYLFRLAATREPTPNESRLLQDFYAEQRDAFAQDTAGAAKLIHIGESKSDPALKPSELAAATMLAQAVLNMDATIWKR